MNKNSSIFVAGASKGIGVAVVEALGQAGYSRLLTTDDARLSDQAAVEAFFAEHRPEVVVLAAGKSGGISFNVQHPAELIYDNLMTETNVISSAHRHGAKKLLYLASSCSYPRLCAQPIKEEYLLTGPLEPTNQPYAVAKIAGIELCRAYRAQYGCNFVAAVPTNYFGPGDDFSPENSHVVGALMRRMHAAKQEGAEIIDIWGTGAPRREFIYSKDLAQACVFLLENYDGGELLNIGTGASLSIAELAAAIGQVVGYTGRFHFDVTKPDGMPVKELDSTRLSQLGWRAGTPFLEAVHATYAWFLQKYS